MFEECDSSHWTELNGSFFQRFNKVMAKFELIFVLKMESAFSQRFRFKANRQSI